MRRVVIDTNALMAIEETGIDLFGELEKVCTFSYTLGIVSASYSELEKIAGQSKGKAGRSARLALSLIKAKGIVIIDAQGYADDALVQCSAQGDIVLTVDRELRSRLCKPYLTIRQGKKIVLVE